MAWRDFNEAYPPTRKELLLDLNNDDHTFFRLCGYNMRTDIGYIEDEVFSKCQNYFAKIGEGFIDTLPMIMEECYACVENIPAFIRIPNLFSRLHFYAEAMDLPYCGKIQSFQYREDWHYYRLQVEAEKGSADVVIRLKYNIDDETAFLEIYMAYTNDNRNIIESDFMTPFFLK